MKNRVIDVTEAYKMGLNKDEIMDMVDFAYEAEAAEAKAKAQALTNARKRVIAGTYTEPDLDVLLQALKERPQTASEKRVVGYMGDLHGKTKAISVTEFEDLMRTLNPLP